MQAETPISSAKSPSYRVTAEIAPSAFFAVTTGPDLVELITGSIHDLEFIRKYTSLEISLILTFHSDSGTGKIRRTDISLPIVKVTSYLLIS